MGNLMTSMWTGVSGLKVNQTGLNATGHNLANVDTQGFVRQQVLTSDSYYNNTGVNHISTFQIGLGTDMATIRQVRDVFLDKSYRLEVGRQGFYESQSEAVQEMESLFGEMEGVQFQNSIKDFWETIQELSKEPDDPAKRKLLIESGISFLERAGNIYDQIEKYQVTLNAKVQSQVDRINQIGEDIHKLNDMISKEESSGQTANDYRDARNQLLDELGEMVKISYSEDSSGVVSVNVEGVPFVNQDKAYKMETQPIDDTTQMLKVVWTGGNGGGDVFKLDAAYNMASQTDIGSLKGLLVARGNDTAQYTDIPVREDYPNLSAFQNAVTEFNNKVNPSIIMSIQAQFDQLVHGVVTAINDVFCPNSNVTDFMGGIGLSGTPKTIVDTANGITYTINPGAASIDEETDLGTYNRITSGTPAVPTGEISFVSKGRTFIVNPNATPDPTFQVTDGRGKVINGGTCTVTNPGGEYQFTYGEYTYTLDGTGAGTDQVKSNRNLTADEVLLWDEGTAPVGMDKDKTEREAMFNRRNMDRYQEATLTYEEGGVTKTKTVYLYNREDPEKNSSLFTLGEIEVNPEVKKDYSKLPLNANKYQGKEGAYDMTACDKLVEVWGQKFATLDPNVLDKNTFMDYYTAMISELANRGQVYDSIAEEQRNVAANIDTKRQGVIGVSSDEELTNLVRFQHAYNASAKYISVIDQMLQHILEKLG